MIATFKDTRGQEFTLQEICDLADADYGYEMRVGSDSQVHRKERKIKYVTCVVLYKKGKGGRYFQSEEWVKLPPREKIKDKNERKKKSMAFLRERLTSEVWRSAQTGLELMEILPENINFTGIDLDLNQDPKHRSNRFLKELKGMVEGMGFECRAKPDSWAAMCVADRGSK